MIKFRRKKLIIRPIPFTKLLANVVTLIGLIIGVSSIRFALDSRWEIAIYCIILATIIDGLDGKVARFFNASSHFGAELDSLCDFVNFGLCPALLIYLWSLQQYEYKLISWASIMLFVLCMALRLARFNAMIFEPNRIRHDDRFFIGVPAPCGAILALIPMILDLGFSTFIDDFNVKSHTLLIDLYIVIIAILLPSRLPTVSLKKLNIKPEHLSLTMIISAMIVVLTLIYPWYLLPVGAILYILSIPVCIYIVQKS